MVDDLGLSRALAGRMVMVLVGAMVVLAALGVGGAIAAGALAREWRAGAGSVLMVEVPGGPRRAERALEVLRADPGVTDADRLSEQDLSQLLQPWLGEDVGSLGLNLPAVIEVHLARGTPSGDVAARLASAMPGAVAEASQDWAGRLRALGRSLAACAGMIVVLVLAVAVALVSLAASAGLSAQRETIEILHLLGAADGDIADRFARRLAAITFVGGVGGALVALPVLVELAQLAAPFGVAPSEVVAGQPLSVLTTLPGSLWAGLIVLPPAAAAIGWVTAEVTVRGWLRRLP